MGNQDDKAFMKRFSGVIFGLVLVTVLIIIIANFKTPPPEEDVNPSRIQAANERTQPVGAVRTEMPKPEAAAEVAQAAPAKAQELSGSEVFSQVCQACHLTGAAGAPKPGTDAFKERAAKGEDTLVSSAIHGLNAMPPKGGRMDLSDAEIKAAVEYMMAQ